MKKYVFCLIVVLSCTSIFAQQPPQGLRYEIVDGRNVTITKYTGNAAILNIPGQIGGLPVTSIGFGAFDSCTSLTSVTIPSSVTEIGYGAFGGCTSLTSVTIPSSVISIEYAFSGCWNLTSITVDNRNPAYASIDGVLFDKNLRTLISYPQGRNQRTYVIPSSVTSIGNSAFDSCLSLTSVTIPSSVTYIEDRAFIDCINLTSVTIPSSVTSISDYAFWGCRGLTSLTISFSVTSIGKEAFCWCISLTSVNIPSSVTTIGNAAFYGCDSLTGVTLSRRTQVGENAFPKTTRITYRD